MGRTPSSFRKIDKSLSHSDISHMLSLRDPLANRRLLDAAYWAKSRTLGRTVFLRGLIEISNVCRRNCFYCGIRRDNASVKRYQLTQDQILDAARLAHASGFGSIVLQGGERKDAAFVDFIARTLTRIRQETDRQLGITLSLGEQSADTYGTWFRHGADRYLLRLETTNPDLFRNFHPDDQIYADRLECLAHLRRIGYQVGTGVMIGLPGQTPDDLADDILFFKEHDIDMVGMGPFIPHPDTVHAPLIAGFDRRRQLQLSLRMIALTRLVLPDVNIAATTALQALDPEGRELGLKAGANVVMPNLTDAAHRGDYLLYPGKPQLDEASPAGQADLRETIGMLGEQIGFGLRGDPLHFSRRLRSGRA
ncbi:[FeFe] hydrogenase H-cluster radical SAM maturase HydE [bacterium]|nr:[FeFe] hydrogenase H-cluster radical SAM maturase HydE [bacterium]